MKRSMVLATLITALGGASVAQADMELACKSSDESRLESHLTVHESEGVFSYSVSNCIGLAHVICRPYKDHGLVEFHPEDGTYQSDLVGISPLGTGYEFIDKRGAGLSLTFDQCN
jgi:hypothetical protein